MVKCSNLNIKLEQKFSSEEGERLSHNRLRDHSQNLIRSKAESYQIESFQSWKLSML